MEPENAARDDTGAPAMNTAVDALGADMVLDEATPATLDAFLAQVERRAFRMAEMQLRHREDAMDAVQDAMLRLVKHYRDKPATEWAPLFWGILRRRVVDLQRLTPHVLAGILPRVYPQMLEVAYRHQDAGRKVFIVTAASNGSSGSGRRKRRSPSNASPTVSRRPSTWRPSSSASAARNNASSSLMSATSGTGTRCRRRKRPTSPSTPPFSWAPCSPGAQKKASKP